MKEMKIEVIKKSNKYEILKKENKSNKLRVAAYARVSTDLEEQQSSFISQQKYYLDKICSNPNWEFVDIYADEGITGTSTAKRENFQRMIRDALDGKIDIILTKSISRFARNTVDTLENVRKLRAKNVEIRFEEENISTMDMRGELLLTVLSSVAQQESENTSLRVRVGLKMKKERGEVVGNASCYGYMYDLKKKNFRIIEKEARIVQMIYNLYIKGFGTSQIKRYLENLCIPSPKGKSIWSESTINKILKNEKYAGDLLQGKSYTVDPITHKRAINHGEDDMYLVKDHHEAIISREDFDLIQEKFKSKRHAKYNGKVISTRYSFSGKFRCGFCGKIINRRLVKANPLWECRSVTKVGRYFCPDSRSISEEIIKECFSEAFQLLTSDDEFDIESLIETTKIANQTSSDDLFIQKLKNEKKEIETKISKLVDLLIDGKLDNETFDKKQKIYQEEIKRYDERINEILNDNGINKKSEIGMKRIRDFLARWKKRNTANEFDPEVFEELVDYGIIGGRIERNENEPYLIRFICNTGFRVKTLDDIDDSFIVTNNSIINNDKYEVLLDFESKQHFYNFTLKNNKKEKTLVNRIRVTVEVEK